MQPRHTSTSPTRRSTRATRSSTSDRIHRGAAPNPTPTITPIPAASPSFPVPCRTDGRHRNLCAAVRPLAALLLFSASGCGGQGSGAAPPPQSSLPAVRAHTSLTQDTRLKRPALISIDLLTGDLLYWPLKDGPGGSPI